jgi:hypothetical protein
MNSAAADADDGNILTAVEVQANMPPQRQLTVDVLTACDKVLCNLVEKFADDTAMFDVLKSQDVSHGVLLDLMRNAASTNPSYTPFYQQALALLTPIMEYAKFVQTPNSNSIEQNTQIMRALEKRINAAFLSLSFNDTSKR